MLKVGCAISIGLLLGACAPKRVETSATGRASPEKPSGQFSATAMTEAVLAIESALSDDQALAALNRSYQEQVQLDPQNPFRRFLWAYSIKDRNQAWSELTKITKLNDRFFWAYLGMGVILDGWGVYDQAWPMFAKALELGPDIAIGHARLGRMYLHQKQAAPAVERLSRAVELDPRRLPYQLDLARALVLAGEAARAQDAYLKALSLAPDSVLAHRELAELLAGSGKTEAAIEHLGRAVELSPEDCQAQRRLAEELQKLERSEQALEQWQVACYCRPTDISCWKAQAALAEKLQRAEVRRTALEQVLEVERRDLEACRALGPIYLDAGEVEKAQAVYQVLLEADASDLEALAGLATIYERGGQYAQALELAQQLLQLRPDHQTAAEIQKRLFSRFRVLDTPISGSSPQAVFTANRRQIAEVYKERLKKKPALAGELLIKVTVNNQGQVTDAVLARDTLGDQVIELCALWNLRRSRFPSGMGATYDFELTLKPGQ